MLDRQIAELTHVSESRTKEARIAGRITALGRHRIKISATLLNRRTEAAKEIIDLSRWFNGNDALLRSPSIERKSRRLPVTDRPSSTRNWLLQPETWTTRNACSKAAVKSHLISEIGNAVA